MSDMTHARARAQFYGPEMLRVIEELVARLEAEIVSARPMNRAQVTDLLLSFLEPLVDVRDQVINEEGASDG